MNRKILWLGLAFPGAGSLARGRWGEALLAAWTVGFLVALAIVGLVVVNVEAWVSPFQPERWMAALAARPLVTPQVVLTFVVALAVHVISAVGPALPARPGR